MTDLAAAVADGDLDALIRLVDGLCSSRDWARIVELRDRCRHAHEERGLQLWPAAEYAEYRLALEGSGEFAAGVVTEEAGRFALGPLWEVAASTHEWSVLAPHLRPGPARALAAHERALRGEDLEAETDVDRHVLEIPLRVLDWEPTYSVASFRADDADFDALSPPSFAKITLPEPGVEIDDDESIEALIDIGSVWAQQSNGTATAVAVHGSCEAAVAALGHGRCLLVDTTVADAFARIAWAGASGGAYGKRRGGPMGRFAAWWLGATLTDLEWPVDPREMETAVGELRWVLWEPSGFTGGWSACIAVESPSEGIAWALEAVDSYREEDVLAEA